LDRYKPWQRFSDILAALPVLASKQSNGNDAGLKIRSAGWWLLASWLLENMTVASSDITFSSGGKGSKVWN
jgi:hypothetical protein